MFVCNRARNELQSIVERGRPGRFNAPYHPIFWDGFPLLSHYGAAHALTTNRRQYLITQNPSTAPHRSPPGTPSITTPTHSISSIPESPGTPPVTPYRSPPRTPPGTPYRSPPGSPSIATPTHSISPIPESPRAR